MKNLSIIFFTALLLQLIVANHLTAQTVYFQGSVSSDTTWSADTLVLTGDVQIDSNVCLNITAGTYISIPQYNAIWSYGSIKAIGSLNDSIIFTHADTLQHSDTSTINGGWHGIRFLPRDNPDTSIFTYCRISNGKSVVPGSDYMDENPDNLGGNIYGTKFGSMIIKHSKIYNGRANDEGGGIFLELGDYVLIDSCDFRYNIVFRLGGGAHLHKINNILVSNSLFYKNKCYSNGTGQGAGLSIRWNLGYTAKAIVENNRLFGNVTLTGIIYDEYKYAKITGNIICNNYGTALTNANLYAHSVYANNTIVNNVGDHWCGINTMTPDIYIVNNIIRNNRIYPNYLEEQVFSGNYPPPTVEYSNIELGFEGEGNIDSIPLFVNPTEGIGPDYNALLADWRLQDDSPSVNTGIYDTTGLYLPEYDLDGNPRIFGNRIDMGAYENQNVFWVYTNESIAQGTGISVYPNPANDYVVFEVIRQHLNSTSPNAEIHIYDIMGNMVDKLMFHHSKTTWNTSQIKAGVYTFIIISPNDRSRGKIVVRY